MQRLTLLLSVVSALALSSCQKGAGDENVAELSARVDKLEAEAAKFKKIEAFISPIMKQQEQEAERRAAKEPDPDARFAVDIEGNPSLGPAGAAVTVIEAFDFA